MLALGTMTAGAQPRNAPDVSAILMRVGERVQEYYARAVSVICLESVSLRQLGTDLTSDGSPVRRLVFELRIGWQPPADGSGPPEASVLRQIVTIDGRPPRPKDKPRCGDPPPVLPDTLEFLLPGKQEDTVFRLAGRGKAGGHPALMIDYQSRQRGPGTLTEHDDDPDCISMEVPGMARGRIWIDEQTADVLRLDEHLIGPVDMRWSKGSTSMSRFQPVVIERLDSTVTFRPVAFTEPEERVMLPAQVDSMRVIRNLGDPRMRTTQRFSNYRRFTTDARIVE